MTEQWMYQRLLELFYQTVGNRSGYTYRVAGNRVIISDNLMSDVDMGRVDAVSGLSAEKYKTLFLLALENAKHQKAQKEKNNMAQEMEATINRARKIGDKWGYWLLAIQPNLPFAIVREMSLELAKLYGFNDLESGMEFGAAIYDRYAAYHETKLQSDGFAMNSKQLPERNESNG